MTALTLLGNGELAAQDRNTILAQGNAPVRVVEYDARVWGEELGETIYHDFRVRNDSDRGIVAVKLGLLCYDVFNEFQDETETILVKDLSPGERTDFYAMSYPDQPRAFYTGVIYVRKVRFLDGEIWEAPTEELDALLQEFEASLSSPSDG